MIHCLKQELNYLLRILFCNKLSLKVVLQHPQITFFPVPFDKASYNVTFKCKRYYVQWILKEVRVTEHENEFYRKAKKSCDELLDENLGFQSD